MQMDLDLLNFLLKVGDDGFAVLMIIAEYYQLINVQKRWLEPSLWRKA